jgi:hypothetical protein
LLDRFKGCQLHKSSPCSLPELEDIEARILRTTILPPSRSQRTRGQASTNYSGATSFPARSENHFCSLMVLTSRCRVIPMGYSSTTTALVRPASAGTILRGKATRVTRSWLMLLRLSTLVKFSMPASRRVLLDPGPV